MRSIQKSYCHLNLESLHAENKVEGWYKPIPLNDILTSEPKKVATYDELVMNVAQILHRNREHIVFYRGQNTDHKVGNAENSRTSILPSIYRKCRGQKKLLLKKRFIKLNQKVQVLREVVKASHKPLSGRHFIYKYDEIAWAILQHYEVCETPLLDLTHSLHVACSFAFHNNLYKTGIIYLLGMPKQLDNFGINTFEELINLRLLSITPPEAKRPFFQEGYLAGPYPNHELDITTKINQFDFARRLIAKFEIPIKDDFWGSGFYKIPSDKLFPTDDEIGKLCADLVDKNCKPNTES